MKISDTSNPNENWHEVLSLWNKVVNWSHYKTSEKELKQQIKTLILFMWNEKDWLKKEYPAKSRDIEEYVNESIHIKIVADLANGLKHRGVDRSSRSGAQPTDFYQRITFGSGKTRQMIHIQRDDGSVVEMFQILKGVLCEYEVLSLKLLSNQPLKAPLKKRRALYKNGKLQRKCRSIRKKSQRDFCINQ